ncbi:MAG: transposase, partial [Bacteroidales bacterium]|nr:transposase [Bacteroidales bacterium]
MSKVPQKYPNWVIKYKKKNMEIRYIRGKYYLYGYSHIYDPVSKSSKKITGKFYGAITEEGLQEPKVEILTKKIISTTSCSEFGVSYFVLSREQRVDALKKYFPKDWRIILALAYTRLLYQSPIKRMVSHLEHSYLSKDLKLFDYNEVKIRETIKMLGENRELCLHYMKEFIKGKDFILIDATEIAYASTKSNLSQHGYNGKWIYQSQLGLLYLYSTTLREPIYYRITGGNIREVKSLSLSIAEAGISDVTVIGDKGFYSRDNINNLKKEHLN